MKLMALFRPCKPYYHFISGPLFVISCQNYFFSTDESISSSESHSIIDHQYFASSVSSDRSLIDDDMDIEIEAANGTQHEQHEIETTAKFDLIPMTTSNREDKFLSIEKNQSAFRIRCDNQLTRKAKGTIKFPKTVRNND